MPDRLGKLIVTLTALAGNKIVRTMYLESSSDADLGFFDFEVWAS
mgnify:CR=1 FL=1